MPTNSQKMNTWKILPASTRPNIEKQNSDMYEKKR